MIEAQHADHRALERKGSLTFVQQTSARNTDRNPSVEISPGGRPCPFWRQSGGVHTKTGATTIERGLADAVAFGRMFIANPDLRAYLDRRTSHVRPVDLPMVATRMLTPTIPRFTLRRPMSRKPD